MKKYEEQKDICQKLASDLHSIRLENAKKLSKGISDVLVYLDMGKVIFSVKCEIKRSADSAQPIFGELGYDEVEFMISTNPGEPLKPLVKIASGGELSRVMLATKCVLMSAENVPTVIFDEVDTGVSGKTSHKIGIKLRQI